MPTRYKKPEGVQTLLLDTAETLFAEQGYFGVSVRDITNIAEVRNASINGHFESKGNLFLAIIGHQVEPLAAAS